MLVDIQSWLPQVLSPEYFALYFPCHRMTKAKLNFIQFIFNTIPVKSFFEVPERKDNLRLDDLRFPTEFFN